ncbi:hypothetical protein [Actinacidiphila soli]|uniref:hypothetical protein n=1 Tax=Actinacidiphila soli TaxID=2487275 RepID=UPI0038990144
MSAVTAPRKASPETLFDLVMGLKPVGATRRRVRSPYDGRPSAFRLDMGGSEPDVLP